MKKTILCIALLIIAFGESIFSQQIGRRARLGALLTDSLGCYVKTVVQGSSAEKIGLKDGDVLLTINNMALSNHIEAISILSKMREGDSIFIEILRDNMGKSISGELGGVPYDSYDFADVVYDSFVYQGGFIRNILIKPKGEGRFPTLFFIPGYTCSSIDNMGEDHPYEKFILELVKNGIAVCKTEKPGMGDCVGTVSCEDADLYQELAVFKESYNQLHLYDFVDTNAIYIFGHSMGGVYAPLLDVNIQPKGIAVFGTVVRSWFEYFIEQMRVQRFIIGEDYLLNDSLFNTRASFYYNFMVEKKSPDELRKNSNFAQILTQHWNNSDSIYMSGRNYKFWQQLQDANIIMAWSKYGGEVLSMWGQGDFIAFSEYDHRLLAQIINKKTPGKATFISIPDIDHGFVRVNGMEDAVSKFRNYNYRLDNYNCAVAKNVLKWIKDRP